MTEYFCRNQYISSENSFGYDGCCKLRLGDGVVFLCPYSKEDIELKKLGKDSSFIIEKCNDFVITSGVKKDFLDNLKKIKQI